MISKKPQSLLQRLVLDTCCCGRQSPIVRCIVPQICRRTGVPYPILSPSPSWFVGFRLSTYHTGTQFPGQYKGAQDFAGGRVGRRAIHGRVHPQTVWPRLVQTLANVSVLLIPFPLALVNRFSLLDCASSFSSSAYCGILSGVAAAFVVIALGFACRPPFHSYLGLPYLPCPPGASPDLGL